MPGVGHWDWAAGSPDGKTILALWRFECEVPAAFLIRATGGRPRSIFGDAESVALGWTTDGRAIVFLPSQPACGSEGRPGTYLVSPDGRQRTFVGPAKPREDPPIEPSIEPRTVEEVTAAAAP